jgi:hypothetical protein
MLLTSLLSFSLERQCEAAAQIRHLHAQAVMVSHYL